MTVSRDKEAERTRIEWDNCVALLKDASAELKRQDKAYCSKYLHENKLMHKLVKGT